jgi:prohibitin 1
MNTNTNSTQFFNELGLPKLPTGGIKKIGILFALLVLGAILLFTTFRQIGTGEIGVVTRYGKVTGRELGEGLHVVLPFGIDQVTIYDVKVNKLSDEVAASTKDLQDVNTTLALNYRLDVGQVSNLHKTVGPTYVSKIIEPAMNEVFKANSAKFSATELLANRAELKAEAVAGLKERLDKYGIRVEDLSVVNFQFSPTFTKAIEEKQAAEQNVQRAKFNLEAAQTDAQAQQSQSLTLSDLYLRKQAIEKWNGQLPNYLGQGTVFNIPLQ